MWEGVGDRTKTATYWPPTLLAITAFLFRSPGLLNRGPGAQPLLRHGSHSSIFSPTRLNFLSTGLYNNLTSTYFLRASQFALNSTPRQSRSPPDIFDRMHLLFTQVHFIFWPLDRGQYVTSFFVDETLLPRKANLFTSFRDPPFSVEMSPLWLKHMNSVLSAFTMPPSVRSRLCSRNSAGAGAFARSAMSLA